VRERCKRYVKERERERCEREMREMCVCDERMSVCHHISRSCRIGVRVCESERTRGVQRDERERERKRKRERGIHRLSERARGE